MTDRTADAVSPQRPTVEVNWGERPVHVPCLPTPLPGLVLAELPNGSTSVTHARSGLGIAVFDSAEPAAAFLLHEIAPIGADWTQSGDTLLEEHHGKVDFAGAAGRWGGYLPSRARPGDSWMAR